MLSAFADLNTLRIPLTPSTIRVMAQKDHLPKLTSLETGIAFEDMDDFIDMLETRWVRGIKA